MASVSPTNLYVVRGAGLSIGLQQTPLDPDVTPLSGLGSDPQKAHVHITAGHTKSLFSNFDKQFVKKIRMSPLNLGNYTFDGKLKLRTTRKYTTGEADVFYSAVDMATLLGFASYAGAIYDSEHFTGGDDKHYQNLTVINNLKTGVDPNDGQPLYTITTATYEWSTTGTNVLVSSNVVYDAKAKNTSGNAFLGNGSSDYGGYDFTDNTIYVTYSGLSTYEYISTVNAGTYETDYRYLTPRYSDQAAHGLNAYPYLNDDAPTAYNSGTYPQAIYTFKGGSAWVPTRTCYNIKIRCRLVYQTPNSCEDCWYEGAEVVVKIKYKSSTMTRTLGSAYYTTAFGAWSAHSEVTKTVTLPASSPGFNNFVELGEDFDVPEEAGKAIVIDDIEVISVTPPAPPPP